MYLEQKSNKLDKNWISALENNAAENNAAENNAAENNIAERDEA